ncbi:MAG: hypothetical protein Q7J55_01230 [bacterium]|nr:hypothetical protein [bacterium]
MKKFSLFFIIAFLLPLTFIPHDARAHGVVYELKKDKTVIIKVAYDDGEPMSYAEVKIFSPHDTKIEYQNGRTDKNGCFAFLPDQIGEWKVIVNDGMGHGVVTEVKVFTEGESTFGGKETMKIEATIKGWPRWQKLVTGISIIWGLAGLIFYFRVRKRIA